MNIDRQQIGRDAEERAAHRLAQAGLTLVARNYRCRAGELDIVAIEAGVLVIAEVRLRSRADFGGAAASITASKRRRITRAARHLLARNRKLARLPARFDVLLVDAAEPIEWIRGAFDAT
jgi:putative endonuclease